MTSWQSKFGSHLHCIGFLHNPYLCCSVTCLLGIFFHLSKTIPTLIVIFSSFSLSPYFSFSSTSTRSKRYVYSVLFSSKKNAGTRAQGAKCRADMDRHEFIHLRAGKSEVPVQHAVASAQKITVPITRTSSIIHIRNLPCITGKTTSFPCNLTVFSLVEMSTKNVEDLVMRGHNLPVSENTTHYLK